jgi:DNA replication and repair protein RecF
MQLNQLSLLNFKNIAQKEFSFDAKVNCFVGQNGVGKTNALDSIYVLAFGKSYFNPISSQNIKHDEEYFVVDGNFENSNKSVQVTVSLKKGQKKIIKKNGKIYDKISDHIGSIPLVIISPYDRDLITEGSETRRKFMDGVIAQYDNEYLTNLIRYQKVLSQRNSLLKYFAANQHFERETLEIYDVELVQLGEKIAEKRKKFIDSFLPILQKRYEQISNHKEAIQLTYKTHFDEEDSSFAKLLESNLNKDLRLQYTSVGVHKDDLQFEIEGYPIKKFGSQGQQKSYLIALKFAQYDILHQISGTKPILLLDDIFDKLDESRVEQIIAMIMKEELGQVFISDTHATRTEKVIRENAPSYQMIHL